MDKAKLGRGDLVEITAGDHAGTQGTVTVAGEFAVYLKTQTGVIQAIPHQVKLLEKAPPPPYVFRKVDNPDGWSEPNEEQRAALPQVLREGPLAERVMMLHGRPYLAVRGLQPADVEAAFEGDPAALGLQLNHLGVAPGLDAWLQWEGLSRIEHLSFNTGFLGGKGLEKVLASKRLGRVKSLDLSVCDLGQKGLKLLHSFDEMPQLSELYLTANPDYDRTKHNEKALGALLKTTKKSPLGASLAGLKVLGLMFWDLSKAQALLEGSELVTGLETIWVRNTEELPASLRGKAVEGWDKKSA